MTVVERLAADNITRVIKYAIIGLAFSAAVEAVHNVFELESELRARDQYNQMLLVFMRGGLPAVNARCILESKHVVEIAPCVKASTPAQGRQL